MTTTKTKLAMLVAAACAASALAAPAQAEEGSWMVRVRAINIAPADDSGAIPALGIAREDVLDVESKWAPDVDIEYFFGGPLSVELLLTIPQEHEVVVDTGTARIPLGTFDHLPPTLTLKYNFRPEGTFRPYVGAGVNYTRIMDTDLAVPGTTPLPLDLDQNSFGLAVQAGFDWKLADRWFLSADAKWIDIDADVKVKATGTRVTTAKVDPLVLGLGIGYRF